MVFDTDDLKLQQKNLNNKLQIRFKQHESTRNHNTKVHRKAPVNLNKKTSPNKNYWSSTGNTLTNSSCSEASSVGASDCSSFSYDDDHEAPGSDLSYLTEEVVDKHEPFESEECIYRKPANQNFKDAEGRCLSST